MRGFTTIELLIVISITIILATAALPIYGSFQVSTQLNEQTSLLIQTYRTARQRSIVRYNGAAHGVYIDIQPSASDKVILYQGDSYATRVSEFDRMIVLDAGLSLSHTLSGDDVHFSPGHGVPSATGTVTLAHDASGNRTIDINAIGRIEEL